MGMASHIACAIMFLGVGISVILESYSLLPEDTMRRSLSLAFLMFGFVIGDHATDQDGSPGVAHHVFQYICVANSATFAYSVYHKNDILAGISAYVLLLMNSIWWFTFSLLFFPSLFAGHVFRENLPEKSVILPIYVMEFSLLAILSCIVAAYENSRTRKEYLKISPLDEEV